MADIPLRDLHYVRGILRNRLPYVNEGLVMLLMEDAVRAGVDVDDIRRLSTAVVSWTEFREVVEQWESARGVPPNTRGTP